MESTMSSLVLLFTAQYAPMQSAMLAHLEIDEVIALSRTCKPLNSLWNTFVSTSFDINKLLRGYFPDPISFRALQAEHAILIMSGSALQFFGRRQAKTPLLEIAVSQASLPAVEAYILGKGYVPIPGIGSGSELSDRGFINKVSFGRACGICIYFHESAAAFLSLALSPHTTASMCLISWENAYCLFPVTTFIRHEAVLTLKSPGNQPAAWIN